MHQTAPAPDRPWLYRTYAGHSSAAASNALFKANLARGQTGLSVAFDLPTQTGYDSDHPLAGGEVGRVGVPICSIADLERLFDGIPLAAMNTSMTINATAPWLLALYIVAAERQGTPRAALAGTVQNDLLKEYLSRGTYMLPPEPSLRLTCDVIAFAAAEMPKWNPINVCSYHLQEAGATPVQELAFTLANAIAVLDALRGGGQVAPEALAQVVGRVSFFVNAGVRFVTEMCKMRAFAELWDEITHERYGVADPSLRRFRYGVQVNSLGLTEQQPENNVYRILLSTLAVVLSKSARARAVQLPAWNEALGLPRPWDQQWSLRLQQILALETDLLEFEDLFEGSPVVAARVAALKDEARAELARIEALGGALAAVDLGYMKQGLVESGAARLAAVACGAQKLVGVNCHRDGEPAALAAEGGFLAVDPAAETEQVARLEAHRAARDPVVAAAALEGLRSAAREGRNVMDPSIACARAGVTTGEWGQALREIFGDLPRADRARRPRRRLEHRRGRGGLRARRAADRKTRAAAEDAGRQARPRRPFQRRRADRGVCPRLRLRGGLRRHPPDARPDRQRGARGGRARGRPVDPLGRARHAGARGAEAARRARPRRAAGRGRRHHPARRRRGAARPGRRPGVHAQGLRARRGDGRAGRADRAARRGGAVARARMSPIRAAVVGCGHFGRHHAEKYAACAGAELVAVVDCDPAAAQRLADRLGVPALTDPAALEGVADAASVAVPTSAHLEVAGRLLERGLHVLVEKPIAASLADARALIALAARRGRILQVGHLERFNAALLALDDVIDRPLFIESHRIAPFSERGTDVDVVLDLMIHDIDLIQLLVGRPLATVDAVGVPVLSGHDDIANARLRFEGGCVANVTASRVSFKSERRMRLFQRDAYISIDFSAGAATIARRDAAACGPFPGVGLEQRSIGANDALMLEIEAFVAAIRGERRVAVSGEDGRLALDAALRITAALQRPP